MFVGWLNRRNGAAENRVRLSLPEPHAGCHPHARPRPAEFKAWLTELPTANPVVTSEQVAYQLALLTRYPQKINRLQALLRFAQPVIAGLAKQVDALLLEHLDGAETALHNRLLTTFSAAHLEFVHLQKRLINDFLEEGRVPPAELLGATLVNLAQQIRLSLTRYNGTPPGPWRDMLRVYTLAGSLDLLDSMMGESPGNEWIVGTKENPHHVLIGTLLYQLTDPLQLPAAQNLQLFDYAITLARHARLTVVADSAYLIPVDRSGALPPLSAARGVESPAPNDVGYLDVRGIIDHLAAITEPELYDALLLTTLRELTAEYSEVHGRRHPRTPRQAPYEMYIGICAIHQRLSQLSGNGTQSQIGNMAIFAGSETPNFAKRQAGISCQQVNYSAGGAAFQMAAGQFVHGQVGDLVLFENRAQDTQQRPSGLIARIRRLLRRDETILEIGVEKVNARLTPVQIKGLRDGGRALIDPVTLSEGWQLFATADAVRNGAVLELQSLEGALHVRVERELERAPNMVHALVRRMT